MKITMASRLGDRKTTPQFCGVHSPCSPSRGHGSGNVNSQFSWENVNFSGGLGTGTSVGSAEGTMVAGKSTVFPPLEDEFPAQAEQDIKLTANRDVKKILFI